jgi:hypothetical protein
MLGVGRLRCRPLLGRAAQREPVHFVNAAADGAVKEFVENTTLSDIKD